MVHKLQITYIYSPQQIDITLKMENSVGKTDQIGLVFSFTLNIGVYLLWTPCQVPNLFYYKSKGVCCNCPPDNLVPALHW